ncbi:hypothetical protein [Streptomyces tritici]|uniref:hypothetical protein n=1 Tax=Streptomyces tritici TaxID=2054410 RepID=UPI003AF0D2C4
MKNLHISLHEALARVVRELGQPQPELTVAVIQAVVDACIRRIDQGDDLTTVSDFAAGATRRLLSDDDLPHHRDAPRPGSSQARRSEAPEERA